MHRTVAIRHVELYFDGDQIADLRPGCAADIAV